VDHGAQEVKVESLTEKRVGSEILRLQQQISRCPRQHDDTDIRQRSIGASFAEEIPAGLLREHDVEQEQVGLGCGYPLPGLANGSGTIYDRGPRRAIVDQDSGSIVLEYQHATRLLHLRD
jgi:hypothetical protein